MRQPTLTDVARHAGVSYATADRVINQRGNVAEKSTRKVHSAVEDLGYVRNLAAANLSKGRRYRFAFVLPTGTNAFFERMQAHVAAMAKQLSFDQVEIEVHQVEAFEIAALSAHLAGLVASDIDGVAVVGLDRAGLNAPLEALRTRGIVVVSLVSDVPENQRASYVGINNVMAGRTAARLMGMAHSGRMGHVQVVAGSMDARDHANRFTGFHEVLAADFPQVKLLPLIETRDDADVVEDKVRLVRKTVPDLTAIYNIGAGNSGLVRALGEGNDLFCIVHELVSHSREALEDGRIDVIIDQRPEVEVIRAIEIMRALSDQRPEPVRPALLPTIYVKDNLPDAIEPVAEEPRHS